MDISSPLEKKLGNLTRPSLIGSKGSTYRTCSKGWVREERVQFQSKVVVLVGPIGPRPNLFKTCFRRKISHRQLAHCYFCFDNHCKQNQHSHHHYQRSPDGWTCRSLPHPPGSQDSQAHYCSQSSPNPPRLGKGFSILSLARH